VTKDQIFEPVIPVKAAKVNKKDYPEWSFLTSIQIGLGVRGYEFKNIYYSPARGITFRYNLNQILRNFTISVYMVSFRRTRLVVYHISKI